MSSDIRTCWGLLSGNLEALLSTYISVQQYRYLHACLCFCARAKKVCENDNLWNLSSAVGGCQHHIFSAIVHHVRTNLTSTIYEKESIISRFQSSLVSLLGVNELRFHHRYQRHSLFNYSYWACSVRHCCLESIFFFFSVYMQPEGVLNDSLKSGVLLVLCSCTLVVHKLLDCRKQMGILSPCLLTQRSIASVEHNVKL